MVDKVFNYHNFIPLLLREAERSLGVVLVDNLDSVVSDGYYKLECTVNKDTTNIKRLVTDFISNYEPARDYIIEDIDDTTIVVFVFDVTIDEVKYALNDKGMRNYCDTIDGVVKAYPKLLARVNELEKRICVLEQPLDTNGYLDSRNGGL
jgi:hypothetical protein